LVFLRDFDGLVFRIVIKHKNGLKRQFNKSDFVLFVGTLEKDKNGLKRQYLNKLDTLKRGSGQKQNKKKTACH